MLKWGRTDGRCMKHLDEYRDIELVHKLSEKLHDTISKILGDSKK
jgi:hypothetical protein